MASPSDEPATEERPTVRLHRSTTDRVCFGVCSGIADYLAVDPAMVRLAFVVATVWGGIGLVLYVVLAVILPVGTNASLLPGRLTLERSHLLAGVVLIVLGSLLLASNLGLAPWLTWNLFWPCVAILVGVMLLVRQPRRTEA
jgi:phage shock protein C